MMPLMIRKDYRYHFFVALYTYMHNTYITYNVRTILTRLCAVKDVVVIVYGDDNGIERRHKSIKFIMSSLEFVVVITFFSLFYFSIFLFSFVQFYFYGVQLWPQR